MEIVEVGRVRIICTPTQHEHALFAGGDRCQELAGFDGLERDFDADLGELRLDLRHPCWAMAGKRVVRRDRTGW